MSNPRTQEQYDRIIERLAIMEARADMPVRDGHPLWVPNPDTAEEIKRKARAVERIERMEGGLPAAPMAGTPALEAAGKVPGVAEEPRCRKWHDGCNGIECGEASSSSNIDTITESQAQARRFLQQADHLQAELAKTQAKLDQIYKAYLEVAKYVGCGDNSCRFVKPSGMATNGGCRCGSRPGVMMSLAALYASIKSDTEQHKEPSCTGTLVHSEFEDCPAHPVFGSRNK